MPFLKIIRPVNGLFTVLCVFFGAFYLKNITFSMPIFFAALSAFFISTAGYVINDFFDIEIDMINRPDRILPSKQISPKVAYIYAVILFVLGLLASVLTQNKFCILIAFINTILLFYYAKYFKKTFLLGNVIVAFAAGSTFIFGALANSNLLFGTIPAFFAFLYTLIRELIKDAEDVDGDKKLNAKTIPVLLGKVAAIYFSIIPFAIMLWLSTYYNSRQIFPIHTVIAMNILVNIPFTYYLIKLRFNLAKEQFSKTSKFIKFDMLILLLVLLTALI